MAKLADIRITRGKWGTPAHFELIIPCRVLKDGLFRASFPEDRLSAMRQFFDTDAEEIVDETLAGLSSKLGKYADWLAESTEKVIVAIFYETKLGGAFSLSANKLIDPNFTTREQWQTGSISFEKNAALSVGAKIKEIKIATGRDGKKTYTVSPMSGDTLGEFGSKLLAYNVGPDIWNGSKHPKDMPPFVEYTENLAQMFVEEIEKTYYRAIDLREKLDALQPVNDEI